MRIKREEADFIKQKAKEYFGSEATVYLFGSRANDHKKGGDIDLYIETNLKKGFYDCKIKFLAALEKVLGTRKIDVVINNFTTELPVYKVAQTEGVLL